MATSTGRRARDSHCTAAVSVDGPRAAARSAARGGRCGRAIARAICLQPGIAYRGAHMSQSLPRPGEPLHARSWGRVSQG